MAGDPVIIEAAINGVTTKAVNPHVPLQPDEIARRRPRLLRRRRRDRAQPHRRVRRARRRGGRALPRRLAAGPRRAPDAILYPTVGGGRDVQSSYAHIAPLAASGLLRIEPLRPRVGEPRRPRRRRPARRRLRLLATRSTTSATSSVCAREFGSGPSLSIFEPGFLRTAARLLACRAAAARGDHQALLRRRPRLPRRGAAARASACRRPATALDAYLDLLDGCDVPWAVAVLGGDVLEGDFARRGARAGRAPARRARGLRRRRDAHQRRARRSGRALCADVGRPVASCADATDALGFPPPAPAA